MSKRLVKTIAYITLLAFCIMLPVSVLGANSYEECTVKLLQAGDYDINYNYDYSQYIKDPFDSINKNYRLKTIENEYEQIIYDNLICGSNEIGFSLDDDLTRDLVMILYSDVINDHPELFYVSHNYGITSNLGRITTIHPHYIMSPTEIARAKEEFDIGAQKALSVVEDSMDELQKALVLHDYVCTNAVYSESGDMSHSAYGFFKNGKVVCAGYALAYSYLLKAVGIECELVTSLLIGHGWNAVKIGGHWYNVDCTWDDNGILPFAQLPDNFVSHRYFLKSDFIFDLNHIGRNTFDECDTNDTRFDNGAFWDDVNTTIYIKDNKYYYLDPDYTLGKVYLKERVRGGLERNLSNQRFDCDGKITLGLPILYSQLVCLDNKFYVSCKDAIYSVDPNSGKTCKITSFNDNPVGMGVDDNYNLIYFLMQDQDKCIFIDKKTSLKNNISTSDALNNNYADVNNDGYINARDYLMINNK